jgi:hypothetical protein
MSAELLSRPDALVQLTNLAKMAQENGYSRNDYFEKLTSINPAFGADPRFPLMSAIAWANAANLTGVKDLGQVSDETTVPDLVD